MGLSLNPLSFGWKLLIISTPLISSEKQTSHGNSFWKEEKSLLYFYSISIKKKRKRAYPCSLGPSVPGSTQVVQIPSCNDADIQEKKVCVF